MPFEQFPDLVCFAEVEGARPLIEAALRSAIEDHLIGISLLARLLDSPGAMSAAAERIPRTRREMSGDFGEILATVYVEERTPFLIPIRRLRYKADREFPMQGDDIVGLARDGSARLLKGEAKSRNRLDEATVQAADEALNARDGRPKAETLGFLSMRLRELGQDELAERVEAFLDGCRDDQIEHLLFTVSSNDERDLFVSRAQATLAAIRRRVAAVVIPDHQAFIEAAFTSAREGLSGGGA